MWTAGITPWAPDLLVITLALGSAVAFGAADFWGGVASKRAPAGSVVAVTQSVSAGFLLLGLVIWPSSAAGPDLAWGAASGVAGVTGVLLLYKGLAEGRMSVVAPLTGLTAALVPVLWSPFIGEVPGLLALAGIGLALVAIVLVSRQPESGDGPARMGTAAMVRIALASGAAFGVLFILLDETSPASGTWPLVANKLTAVAIVTIQTLVVRGAAPAVPRDAWKLVVACAIAGTTAEVLFLLSTQRGLVAIAAVLTSLYPASTVVLARFVLHERLRTDQLAGFALAAVAVGLIALGA